MIEATEQISAVERQVGHRTIAAGEARVLTISQRYRTTIDDLWDACTTSERLARWFAPVSGDLVLGGRYQVQGNAAGTVERCEPPASFAATWEFGGGVSWIEVRLAVEADGWARFTLEHIAHVDDQKWAEFGPGATGIGWDLTLMGLAMHMNRGGADTREAGMSWMASEDGRRFVTLASDRWLAANITAGTNEDKARAAASRCLAFYTGAGPG